MIPKLLLLGGFVSSILYVTSTVLGALMWEGYDSIYQPVSELSAIGAPSQTLMLVLGLPYSILVIVFGVGVWLADGKRTLRLVAALLVGYGVLCLMAPLTPMHQRGVAWTLTDTLHVVFAAGDVLFILLILIFGAISFGEYFRLYSIVTILVGIVSGILLGFDPLRFGLWERINIYSFMLWVAVFALALWRGQKAQETVSDARAPIARTLSSIR